MLNRQNDAGFDLNADNRLISELARSAINCSQSDLTRLCEAICETTDLKQTEDVYRVLVEKKLLDGENEGAIREFFDVSEKYGKVVACSEVMEACIANQKVDELQKVMDACVEKVTEVNALHDLAFAFLNLGEDFLLISVHICIYV